MGGQEKCIHEVTIVVQQPPECPHDALHRFLFDSKHVVNNRQDAVRTQESHGLIGIIHRGAFAYLVESGIAHRLHAHEDVEKTCLLIEWQDVRVADDVLRPDRRAHPDGKRPCSDFGEHRRPRPLDRRGIFIGQPKEAHVVFAVEPFHLIHERLHPAVAPPLPKHPLTAVGAGVRTSPRELHHRRTPQAKGLISVPICDEFPADAERIQLLNGRTGGGHPDFPSIAPRDTRD